jgi:hypothetical protein
MFERNANQSRRQVCRRFPPGAFCISPRGDRMIMIVGWNRTPASYNPRTGALRWPMSWEALAIENERIITIPWESIRESWTIEEWEAQ